MNHETVKPLFEDATASSELRNFVSLARADGASPAELDRLAKRMAPVLGVSAALVASTTAAAAIGSAPATVGAVGASSFGAPASGLTAGLGGAAAGTAGAAKAGVLSQLLASASAKVLAVSLSVGAAGVGVYSMTDSERPSGSQAAMAARGTGAQHDAPPVVNAPVLPGGSSTTAAAANPPLPAEGAAPLITNAVQVPSTRVTPRRVVAAQSVTPAPVEPVVAVEPARPITDEPVAEQAPSLPPPSELSLIEGAEAARGNAEAALAFLAKHEQLYPRGALAQEREVLAIELLIKSGKLSSAEQRSERFEDHFPKSAHLPRLRALLSRAHAK